MTVPVKVCGITRLEDARAALEFGARALGFIFYRPSPRDLSPDRAAALARALPGGVTKVGVFVGERPEEINRIAALCDLQMIQLHGGEPPEILAELERPAYRAFRIEREEDLAVVEAAPDRTVLLDTFEVERVGGTGKTFHWGWARAIAANRRVILAGGLRPENVRQALDEAAPAGLDVSTGVESAPGLKDAAKIAALFRALSDYPHSPPSPWSANHASAD